MITTDVEDLIDKAINRLSIHIRTEADYGGGSIIVELRDGRKLISSDSISTHSVSKAIESDSYEG